MRGEIGLRAAALGEGYVAGLEQQLTLTSKPWMDSQPQVVECLRAENGHLWLPRYFDQALWSAVDKWEWSEGTPYNFDLTNAKARIDPERGQTTAIPAMVQHLQQHSGGILVAPTGTGKTFMGLTIGASMGRFIGWPVYAGHMEDNAREHAELIGLKPEDVGLVRGDVCELGRPLTIMYIQSLLSRRYPDELYEQIGFLACDEVDHFGAAKWKDTVGQFKARYRLGLSADPRRKDGLDDIIWWTFGQVGHRAKRIRSEDVKPPNIVMVNWRREYPSNKYAQWKKVGGQWKAKGAHPTKYNKLLAEDDARSAMIVAETINALRKKRQVLVFSHFVDHLKKLANQTQETLIQMGEPYACDLLIGGMKKAERQRALHADALFTTFAMARDAFNDPKRDTLIMATPAGDPLQPIGRLREKSPEGVERQPLLCLDVYEETSYAKRKAGRRRDKYRSLGMNVSEVRRSPRTKR